jgi:hypothetical protein
MSRIKVTINHLILRGFEAEDRTALAKGLEAELSRVLFYHWADTDRRRSSLIPVLRLGNLQLEPGPSGRERLGRRIARAIGKGLKP